MKSVKRLFTEFQPERYEIQLEPNREADTFEGSVIINGKKTGRPSKRLTLHQSGLRIEHAELVKNDKKDGIQVIELERYNTQKSYDELRLHAAEMLYPGSYTIKIKFSGQITETTHGIYPCNFELGGKKKQLIATQFESHHAREAFPCIDEPEAKAVFSLKLKTPLNETVIANTPIKDQSKDDASLVTLFEDTPKMSTYLLAFAYGELKSKEATSKSGVKVRIFSTPDKIELTDFGLDVSVKALDFFEDYFGVKYPLQKLDVIGLPDFSAGAMENWGLMTFRESVLYVDPASSSIDTKQFVCMVVSHEVSHQWFGNLVTMRWWNDLWLNESFANLMEYRATDELFPEWNIWEEFTAREMGQALSRDSLPNVQAVRTEVHHPDELSSVFDPAIVYAKGGCLLNMVRNLIGDDAFRKGLGAYFEEFKYQNTEAEDLWKHLAQASGINVGHIMQNWLNHPGYPYINVDYKPGDKKAKLTQQRLVAGEISSTSHTVWQLPISSSWTSELMLNTKESTLKLKPQTDYPLVLNHNAESYFVSRYANQEHFSEILSAATNNVLGTIDRLLLVQSYLLLERAGRVKTTDNLEIFKALANERQESVWSVMAGVVGGVRTLINKDETLEDKLNDFIRPAAASLVGEMGWDGSPNDSSHTQKLRALALSLAAVAGDKDVIEEGLVRFAKFNKPSDISPDIRQSVYFIAVRYGKDADFTKLLNLYKSLNNAEDKDDIVAEITSTRDAKRVDTLLDLITSEHVRLQDAPTWFARLMRNRHATDATWQWLSKNWSWVNDKYGSDKSYDRFPRYAAMAFSYPEQLSSYKKFFEPKSEIAIERAIKLGIEEIEGRLAWRSLNEASVKQWLLNLAP